MRSLDKDTRLTLCAFTVVVALVTAVLLSVSPPHAAPPFVRSAAPAATFPGPAGPGSAAHA